MNIDELMTTIESFVIKTTDPVSKVVSMMRRKRWSCVLISDDGAPLGILTERDVVRLFDESRSDASLMDAEIGMVMTREPMCLASSTSLQDALLLAQNHNVRHFPVVNENEKLVGLVTQTDIVNAYLHLIEQNAGLLQEVNELKNLLHEDAMLKIGNRRAMEVELTFIEAMAKRYNKHYSVALLDVDYFKQYNDHYGHQQGDETLIKFTTSIKNSMRQCDRVFRYGGEELLMLMPDTETEEAISVADKARQVVERMTLPHSKSSFGIVTLSIGVAQGGDEPWPDLVKQADAALYQAKDSGRNRVVSYST